MCLQIENSLIFNHCSQVGSIGFRSIEYDLFIFRSIEANLQLIKNLKEILRSSLPCSIGTRLIKIRKERKIKRIPQHVFFIFFFQKLFLIFSFLFSTNPHNPTFVIFLVKIFKGFPPRVKVRLFYPSFCLIYMFSCIFMDFFSQNFEQRKIGIFVVLVVF